VFFLSGAVFCFFKKATSQNPPKMSEKKPYEPYCDKRAKRGHKSLSNLHFFPPALSCRKERMFGRKNKPFSEFNSNSLQFPCSSGKLFSF
jgi:hypothetical protein